jgi:hypothetical protein
MKLRVGEFVDLYEDFAERGPSEQIVRLIYFHTVLEQRETISKDQIARLFDFAELPCPKNLPQLLSYLHREGKKLLNKKGEFGLYRSVRKTIEQELSAIQGLDSAPMLDGAGPFEFSGKTFTDAKVDALLGETKRCYRHQCWNASGILIRIIIERTLDSVDARVAAIEGLKGKINFCLAEQSLFSKTVREGLKGLHAAKIIGDIAAHHSRILLEKSDVDITLVPFRMLLKEVKTI